MTLANARLEPVDSLSQLAKFAELGRASVAMKVFVVAKQSPATVRTVFQRFRQDGSILSFKLIHLLSETLGFAHEAVFSSRRNVCFGSPIQHARLFSPTFPPQWHRLEVR